MNTFLWILQAVLASAFVGVGLVKLTQPIERLRTKMGWVDDFDPKQVKAIGLFEFLAGLGLVLPAVVDVAPVLTGWAASGLVVLMVGATVTHARRHELQLIVPTLILAALATLAAWGRLGAYEL
jgi:hypothetical protein